MATIWNAQTQMKPLLDAYLERFPEERERQQRLIDRLADPTGLTDRTDMRGHLTASAFVVCIDGATPGAQVGGQGGGGIGGMGGGGGECAVLLIHHRALDRWLQPGGHLESGEMPQIGSWREAHEEVGLPHGVLPVGIQEAGGVAIPLDIDTHPIPARPDRNEGPHYHFDLRYGFAVKDTGWVIRQEVETKGHRWVRESELGGLKLRPQTVAAIRKAIWACEE